MKISEAYPGTPCPSGHPEGANGYYADDQPDPAVYRCDMCGLDFADGAAGCMVGAEPVLSGVVLDPHDLCAVCVVDLRKSFGEEVLP